MARLYRLLTQFSIAFLLAPVAIFFIYFFALRYNIPWFDEFENIPYFLDRFLNAHSFREEMDALLRPNNEHRVLYARLVVLGQYFLTGGLNFANLMLWGNLGLVIIFCLIYYALRRPERVSQQALFGLLPVSLLLFTAQNYLLTFTAIYTLQYLSIIMLVMLTLFVLATNRPANLGLAIGLGALSTFSMGNGLLLWPAGAAMLFIQRRWLALGIWLLAGIISGYLYFLNYPVQQGNAEGFSYLVQHPLQVLAGFLIFAGSVFDLFPMLAIELRAGLPLVAGSILIAGVSYWLVRIVLRKAPNTSFFEVFLFGCLLFLLANVGLIALFRIRFYFGMVLHSSYRTYSLVLWSLACVLLFSHLPEKSRLRFWPLIWLLFLGINVVSYFTYVPEAIKRRKSLQGLTFNQAHNNIGLGASRDNALKPYIINLTTLMRQRGWYQLPEPAITPDERELLAPVRTMPVVPLQVEQKPDYIVVSSKEPDYHFGINSGIYVVMRSDRFTYVMFAETNGSLKYRPWQTIPGFSAALPVVMMEPGRYRLGLFRTYPDRSQIQYTNQFVDVP